MSSAKIIKPNPEREQAERASIKKFRENKLGHQLEYSGYPLNSSTTRNKDVGAVGSKMYELLRVAP